MYRNVSKCIPGRWPLGAKQFLTMNPKIVVVVVVVVVAVVVAVVIVVIVVIGSSGSRQ